MIFKNIIFITTSFVSVIHSAHKAIPLPYQIRDLANPMSTAAILAGEMKFMAEPKAAAEFNTASCMTRNVVHLNSYLGQALKDHLPISDIQGIIAQYLLNRNDSFKCLATFNNHSKFILLIQLNDGRLAFVSKNNTIEIWNLNIYSPGKCVAILNVHNYVNSITQLQDGKLVFGSSDKTIKIWDLHRNKCISTLTGHNDLINSIIELQDGKLASCSDDKTIKIWDLNTNKCISTLTGHNNWVTSIVQLQDGKLASCSCDSTIKIWGWSDDPTSVYKCISTYYNNADSVISMIQLPNDRLVFFSNNDKTTIKVLDLNTNNCVAAFRGHTNYIEAIIQLQDGKLASCSWDGTIKIWDLNTNSCIITLEGHKAKVYSIIQLQDGRIVSSSSDKTVKIWGNQYHELIQPYCKKPDKEKDNKQKSESSCTIL